MVQQSKTWVFTLNNYTDEEERLIKEACGRPNGPTYLLYGREKGEGGTPHLQGYMEFSKKKAMGGIKKLAGMHRMHLEVRRGSQTEACDYCKKDNDFEEFGTKATSQQGARTDLHAIRDKLLSGTSLEDIILEDPETYCKYRNGLQDIAAIARKRQAKNPPRVIIVYGPPGTGKSAFAHSLAGSDEDIWVYPGDRWFCGYTGQRVALFDDYADDLLPKGTRKIDYHFWLRLTDRYKLDVPIKGGQTYWNPEYIVVTTNRDPSALYSFVPDYNKDALMRRVHEIHHFTVDFPWSGLNNLVNK